MPDRVQGPAYYFPSIEKKYGQPISYWLDLISSSQLTKHKQLVDWLKADYGIGHGHATALVGYALSQRAAGGAPPPPGHPLFRKGRLMRKIIAGMFITLDGVVEAPEKWNPPYYDDELNQDVMPLLAAAGTHLYGRRSYELFQGVFTGPAAPPHAGMMTATPKVVVSTTLTDPDWGPTTVISSNITAALTALKQQPGQDITVGASATLVRFLLAEHLLDELRLLVHPVVAGTGKRLFAEVGSRVPLTLLESRPHRNGVVTLRYAPAEATARVPPDSRHG